MGPERSRVERLLLSKFFRSLPARRTCPRCNRTRGKAKFGIRVCARGADGLPVEIRTQSQCRDCRKLAARRSAAMGAA